MLSQFPPKLLTRKQVQARPKQREKRDLVLDQSPMLILRNDALSVKRIRHIASEYPNSKMATIIEEVLAMIGARRRRLKRRK